MLVSDSVICVKVVVWKAALGDRRFLVAEGVWTTRSDYFGEGTSI